MILCYNPERVRELFAQSCPAVCDPMDSSPPGSSVHGILQARIKSPLKKKKVTVTVENEVEEGLRLEAEKPVKKI